MGRKVVETRPSFKKERKDWWNVGNAISIYLGIGAWKKTEVRNYRVFLISRSFMVSVNRGRKARWRIKIVKR